MKRVSASLFFLTASLLMPPALAAESSSVNSVQLAKYCDCYHFQTANLPVFARSSTGASLAHYRSHEMQNCVDIKIDVLSDGEITSVDVGEGTFSVTELAPGPVYFGVRKKVAHAMELVDFDIHHGGTLRFSFLKRFSLFDAFHDDFTVYEDGARRPKTAAELRDILQGPQWGTMDLTVERSAAKEWVLRDEHGTIINEILALMKGRQLIGIGFATGITGMVLAGDKDKSAYSELRCRQSRR